MCPSMLLLQMEVHDEDVPLGGSMLWIFVQLLSLPALPFVGGQCLVLSGKL